MPNGDFFKDAFSDILELQPETAFFAFRPQFGTSATRERFFQNQFRNIHNQFLGALGRQIMSGQDPTLRFTDFLQQPGFFNQQFFATPPSLRGGQPRSVFAPRTRTLFNF